METFTVSRRELHRPGLLKALCAGRVTTRQVANALGLSLRQTRRLRRRFEASGAAGLTHRSRGRPSPRRLRAELRTAITELMTTRTKRPSACDSSAVRRMSSIRSVRKIGPGSGRAVVPQ
jgi:hypothetical protein